MKRSILLLLPLLLAAPLYADDLVRSFDQISLPLADGWVTGSADTGFPIQLVNEDLTAELQIFRSEIPEDDAITNSQQLRLAVDDIVEDVILSLPESQMLTNTGYHEDNRVRFVLEFVSYDSVASAELRHRLTGALYRHPDGHQLLFTLWGKESTTADASVSADLQSMQEGFEYTGPAQRAVFAESADYRWWLLGATIVVLLLVLRMRQRRTAVS